MNSFLSSIAHDSTGAAFLFVTCSKIHCPLLGKKVDNDIDGCRTGPSQPIHVACNGQVRQTHVIVNFISPAMDYELVLWTLLQQLCEKSAILIHKFSSFRQGGVTDETGYGVLHVDIDNASSYGDVHYSSDNVMIIILTLKRKLYVTNPPYCPPPPQQSVKA